jgi:protease I
MEKEGFEVQIVSPETGTIKAWNKVEWFIVYEVEKNIKEVTAKE